MSEAPVRTLVVFLSLVCVNGNALQAGNLQPVQGLYVKPSEDGTTGDLYVAASEDSGASAQWVADQPINFLSNPVSYSSSVTSSSSPREETITSQKRAIYTSQPAKYYENSNALTPYQDNAAYSEYAKMAYYYNYLYPYIMSAAAATAAQALKEAGLSEEMANAVLSHSSTLWQQPAYQYPSPYAADPAWAQSPTAPAPAPAPDAASPTTQNPST